MNSQRNALYVGLVVVSLIWGACQTAAPKTKAKAGASQPPYSILRQPETRTAHVGSYVVFAVRVNPEHTARYQWLTNGVPVEGETNREYFLEHVAMTDAGAYSVSITWHEKVHVTSDEAFLSVYRVRAANNGIAGTLTMPTKQFTSANFTCQQHPTVTLDKGYTPSDSAGKPFFFYGPDVSITNQSGPFLNWTHLTNLTINAMGGHNAGNSTGLQLTDVDGKSRLGGACDANADSGSGPSLNRQLSPGSDPQRARYGVTIYHGKHSPQTQTVDLNWLYY